MEFSFTHLPASLTEPAFLVRLSGDAFIHLVDANPAWLNMMGVTSEEVIGSCLDGFPDDTHVRQFASQLQQALREKDLNLFQDGIEGWVGDRLLRISFTPVCDEHGLLQRILGFVKDATDSLSVKTSQMRMNRRLRALNDCNKALMRAENEQSLLQDVCRIICVSAGYRLAWVGFPEENDIEGIRPVAWAELEGGSSVKVGTGLALGEWGIDFAEMAFQSARNITIQDVRTDPRAVAWRERAQERGIRSNIALPLKSGLGTPFGVLDIYANQPNAFTLDECRLLGELAGDLSFGIEVLRARVRQRYTEVERIWNLHFFESMDKVNRAIQQASNLDHMMGDVLDIMLEIFDCDRAYLLHPCDPDAQTWRVPMERTLPAYPGLYAQGQEMEANAEISESFRILLRADGPVQFGPGTPYSIPKNVAERFELKSFMGMVLYPKVGKPWQFGIHQCSSVRSWSTEEERLLNEIGLRLSDGLNSMLIFRNLLKGERKLKEAERKFHSLVENLPYCISRFDSDQRVLYVNQATTATFGLTSSEVTGKMFTDVGPGGEEEKAQMCDRIRRVFEEGVANPLETKWQTGKGDRYFDVMLIPERDDKAKVVSVLGIAHDITDRKLAEKALRRSEQRYRCIVDTASEGIWVADVDGVTTFVNARMAEMLGYSDSEMLGRPLIDFMFEDDKAAQLEINEALRRGEASSDERRLRCKDGGELWTLASASPILNGGPETQGAITLFTDITERKQQQEQLLYQAHYDPLTGLPNRFLAMDRLEQNIKVAARNSASTALLFLDLDGFKKVNDALGHEVGDQVLMLAAIRLKQAVRNSDTVARLGGDEFVVLIPNIANAESVRPVAEKIVQAFQEVFHVMGRQVMLTASLGVSIYPNDGKEPLLLLRNADTTMYHSKAKGGNAYHYFKESMNQNVARRMQLEEQLRLAIKRQEFYLVYQPIINVSSGQVVAAEALLRWRNGVLGEVPTDEFIDIAEQTGLIIGIGEWVVNTALEQLHGWDRQIRNGFRLSLNVSPRQFRHEGFVDKLEQALNSVGVGGEQVELEITEGILLGGEAGAAEVIAKLRGLGVTISMDDFGTGYSSLSYLRKYRFDTLKIDRIFIRDVIDDPNDRELIVATLRMARSLSVRVVAEGVETGEQLDFLRRESCDCAQGFYLSKPVGAQSFERILNQQPASHYNA
ncbi:MAG: EAL domain-containing protein [Candidatus Thiodiazotropha sp.]